MAFKLWTCKLVNSSSLSISPKLGPVRNRRSLHRWHCHCKLVLLFQHIQLHSTILCIDEDSKPSHMFEAETKFKNKLLTKQLAVYRLRMVKYGRIMSNSEKITNDLNLELWKNGSHSLLSHEVFPVRLLQDHLDWCQIHSLQEPRSTLLSTFSTLSMFLCAINIYSSLSRWLEMDLHSRRQSNSWRIPSFQKISPSAFPFFFLAFELPKAHTRVMSKSRCLVE